VIRTILSVFAFPDDITPRSMRSFSFEQAENSVICSEGNRCHGHSVICSMPDTVRHALANVGSVRCSSREELSGGGVARYLDEDWGETVGQMLGTPSWVRFC
jgi:hypothetical protein